MSGDRTPVAPAPSKCDPKKLCDGKPKFPIVSKFGAHFAVCQLVHNFNSGKGDARPVFTPDMALKQTPITEVEFTSDPGQAAWHFQAVVAACLPDDIPDTDWEIGFIQTAEVFKLEATYSLGKKAVREISSRSRDANPDTTPSPWINPPAGSGPKAASAPVHPGELAELADRPGGKFPIALPSSDPKAKPIIEKIEFTADFMIWLIAKRKGMDSLSDLLFLCNSRVRLSQAATRDMSKKPDDLTAWGNGGSGLIVQGSGPHALTIPSAGKGTVDPVLTTPIAKPQILNLKIK